MRLGAYPCVLKDGSRTRQVYGKPEISERHRHRYEVNNSFRDKLEKAGLVIAGASPDNSLVEIIELTDHPWFIGVQFHPEFQSTPKTPHPLFTAFVAAALAQRSALEKKGVSQDGGKAGAGANSSFAAKNADGMDLQREQSVN
jgi:CTP synthase